MEEEGKKKVFRRGCDGHDRATTGTGCAKASGFSWFLVVLARHSRATTDMGRASDSGH